MVRFRLPAVLALLSLLLLATLDPDDTASVLLCVALMTGALALLYDPALSPLAWRERAPDARDLGVCLLAVPIAFTALGAADLLRAAQWRAACGEGTPLAKGLEWLFQFALNMAPSIPLLATAIAPRHPVGTRPPLWPLGAGLLIWPAGWIGGGFGWIATLRPLLGGLAAASKAVLFGPAALAMAALVLGIGCAFWWRAVRDRGAARFSRDGIFRTVIAGACAAMILGFALLALFVASRDPARLSDRALWLAGLLTMPTTLAWIVTLARLQRIAPANPWTPIAAIALLLVLIPISFAPSALLADTREWVELFVLLSAPLVLMAVAAIWWIVPRLLRRVLDPFA